MWALVHMYMCAHTFLLGEGGADRGLSRIALVDVGVTIAPDDVLAVVGLATSLLGLASWPSLLLMPPGFNVRRNVGGGVGLLGGVEHLYARPYIGVGADVDVSAVGSLGGPVLGCRRRRAWSHLTE